MIGTRIGDWLITEELGDGGHAFVFKGVRDGDVAAIKMLKPSIAHEENLEKRFKIEVEALKSLDHPSIVGFKDYFFSGGYHYMVLEYMDAGAIDHLLRRHGPVEPRYAIPIFYKILEGMVYAHSFGYIHRDIKPNNILLNRKGDAKVTDFGIAKVVGGENLTRQGYVLGTTLYMAPEYLSKGEVSRSTDIYALGVLLYEMLTTRKPFEFKSPDEPLVALAKRVCMGTATPPSAYRPMPAELEKIILKALIQDPKKRYRTVERFQADLKKAFPQLVDRPVEIPEGRPRTRAIARAEVVGDTPSPGSRPRARFRPGVVIAVAAVAGVITGLLLATIAGLGVPASVVLGVGAAVVVMAGAYALERQAPRTAPGASEPAAVPAADEPKEDDDPLPFHGGIPPEGVFEETNTSELNAFLEVTSGATKGRRYGLRPISRIGRDLRFDIRPRDPEISRHHAVVSFNGSGFLVKDTGSTNGTFVNEIQVEPMKETTITNGDILRVGRTSMRFDYQPTPAR
jgi:serine/threonine-protein kinase